jgi:hypothetical protein
MAPPRKNDNLALLIESTPITIGGARLSARPVISLPEGQIQFPGDYEADVSHLADLVITARVRADGSVDALRVEYRPFGVDQFKAEEMAKTLKKINSRLQQFTEMVGFLPSGDFAGYVFRVAAALGIRTYLLRNTAEQEAVKGFAYRKAVATSVQELVAEAVRAAQTPVDATGDQDVDVEVAA